MSNNTPDYKDNLYFDCTLGDNDLTAQWRKGELPEGWYYLKVDNEIANYPVIAESGINHGWGQTDSYSYFYDYDEHNIKEVLAPVPSYEQWQAKLEENARLEAIKEKTFNYDYLSECYSKFIKENAQLKELLKECRYEINPSYIEVIGGTKTFKNLIDKINEVLQCGNIK